jgi:hypothetical protein
MQVHFNLWPGDASFGGTFNPGILPVHEYLDWVQFSAYEGGAFEVSWREDFSGASLPAGWTTGNWASPKNKSTHATENVNFIGGYAVLSLTADDALGPAGAMPEAGGNAAGSSAAGSPGTGGAGPANGGAASGAANAAGAPLKDGDPKGTADPGGCSFRPEPARRNMLGAFAFVALALLRRGAADRRRAACSRRAH